MRVMSLHTEEGFKTVVMGDPGRIWTKYVIIDYPVRLQRIRNCDVGRYGSDLNYPLKKACRLFLKFGRDADITKGAKTLLKGAWAS